MRGEGQEDTAFRIDVHSDNLGAQLGGLALSGYLYTSSFWPAVGSASSLDAFLSGVVTT